MGVLTLVLLSVMIIFLIIIDCVVLLDKAFVKKNFNQSCSSQAQCSYGLVCSPVNNGFLCKKGNDNSCGSGDDCASGLTCSAGVCIYPKKENIENKESKEGTEDPVVLPSVSVPKVVQPKEPIVLPKNVFSEKRTSPKAREPPVKINKQPLEIVSVGSCDDSSPKFFVASEVPEEQSVSESEPSLKTEERIIQYGVIDMCSFSDSLFFLTPDNRIIVEKEKDKKIVTNSCKLLRIFSFAGYLYALNSERKLVYLQNQYLDSDHFLWMECTFFQEEIDNFSSTLDSKFLWLSTVNQGFIFNDQGEIVYIGVPEKRVYGRNQENYLVLKDNFAIKFPEKRRIEMVAEAVLTYHHEVIKIEPIEKDDYFHIVLAHWKPFFLSKENIKE